MLPSFIVVGAEKAGTRTLDALFAHHPEVFMCPHREPKFFTPRNWDKGVDWYASLFDGVGDERVVGETSPAYTWAPHIPRVPQRIREVLGEIKYVYILRHPVKRVISHYNHARFVHWVTDETPLHKALEIKPAILDCSRYHYQLSQYLQVSDLSQWKILLLEELQTEPAAQQAALFDFLGVDATQHFSLPHANKSQGKLYMPSWYRPVFQRMGDFREYVPGFIRRFMQRLAYRVMGTPFRPKRPPTEVVDELTRRLVPDIRELCNLLERDFFTLWNIDAP